jgi:hypothetical protein
VPEAVDKAGTAVPVTMEEVPKRLTSALLKVASTKGAPGPDVLEGGVMPAERAGSSPGGQGKAVPVEGTAVQLAQSSDFCWAIDHRPFVLRPTDNRRNPADLLG